MRIDAHQHFWRLARGDYDWLTPDMAALYRDFLPVDLEPLLRRFGIDGTILVQAAATAAETRFMLEIARKNSFVRGVVGWTDFEAGNAPDSIMNLSRDPLVVGLRPMIQDIGDDDWMLRPELAPAFEALIACDLTFDALVLPRHLKNLGAILERHPAMRVVIDHAAKPQISERRFEDWAADMRRLAGHSQVFCKLSGLVTEAGAAWRTEDLAPYVAHLVDVFGPQRLIWGSDWPVVLLACDYARWIKTAESLVGNDPAVRRAIFGENAARAYRLKP